MIRQARAEELAALSELAFRSKAYWGYSDAFLHSCRQELTLEAEQLPSTFVKEVEQCVVGFYTLTPLSRHRAELDFLFVEPCAMRRGHGGDLLRHARNQASQRGLDAIVIQGDPNAAAFYEAAGAIRIGERPSDSIPGRVLPLYELECAPLRVIRTRGEYFELDGTRIEPHGVNSYPLLQLMGEGRRDAVRDIFAQARELNRTIVRTNAFFDGGASPARLRNDDGTLHEPGFLQLDALLALAAEHEVRLLLVLTNNWADFGGAEAVLRAVAPGEGLPKDAFFSDPRALEAQRRYIRSLVGRTNSVHGLRYAADPSVFAWELINEARCTDARFVGRDTLVRWARMMAEELRGAGARQPVAWGGSGYIGRFGENLAEIAADGAVDVLTVHVYPRLPRVWAESFGARARIDWALLLGASRIERAARIALRHQLPLLLEEVGYSPPPHAADRDAERAEVLAGLIAVARRLGVPSFPWMIGETGRPDYDGHLLRAADRATWAAIRVPGNAAESPVTEAC